MSTQVIIWVALIAGIGALMWTVFHFAGRHERKRRLEALDAFSEVTQQMPVCVQAFGAEEIGLYLEPAFILTRKSKGEVQRWDPAEVSAWYVGAVTSTILDTWDAVEASTEDVPVAARKTQSNYILLYAGAQTPVAKVGYLNTFAGDEIIEVLEHIAPDKRVNAPLGQAA